MPSGFYVRPYDHGGQLYDGIGALPLIPRNSRYSPSPVLREDVIPLLREPATGVIPKWRLVVQSVGPELPGCRIVTTGNEVHPEIPNQTRCRGIGCAPERTLIFWGTNGHIKGRKVTGRSVRQPLERFSERGLHLNRLVKLGPKRNDAGLRKDGPGQANC